MLQKVAKSAERHGFTIDTPIDKLNSEQLKVLLYGNEIFEGVIPDLEKKYPTTDSDYVKKEIERYMRVLVCPTCKGKRLQDAFLAVTVGGSNIYDFVTMPVSKLKEMFKVMKPNGKPSELALNKTEWSIVQQLANEVSTRLSYLEDVGLQYLTMDRSAVTLSAVVQRIPYTQVAHY